MSKTKWICFGTSKFVYEDVPHVKWQCSNCNKEFRIPYDAEYNYCPSCGLEIEKNTDDKNIRTRV